MRQAPFTILASTLVIACVSLSSGAAQAQFAHPVAQPVVGGRQVTVNTNPPGLRARSSHAMHQIVMTPHTFSVPVNAAAAITIDGPGYERATVPVPAEAANLHIDVQMSRPVFEWGIALTALFGAELVTGIILAGILGVGECGYYTTVWEDGGWVQGDCEYYNDDWVIWVPHIAIGGAFTIAGILMMVLDRMRSARVSYRR